MSSTDPPTQVCEPVPRRVGSQVGEHNGRTPRMTTTGEGPRLTPGARRILEVASALFYRHGIHAIGVDTIAAESGVTKRTLYDRFGSKDELVATYLRARDERWRARVVAAVEAETDPVRRALAPFAVLEGWVATTRAGGARSSTPSPSSTGPTTPGVP